MKPSVERRDKVCCRARVSVGCGAWTSLATSRPDSIPITPFRPRQQTGSHNIVASIGFQCRWSTTRIPRSPTAAVRQPQSFVSYLTMCCTCSAPSLRIKETSTSSPSLSNKLLAYCEVEVLFSLLPGVETECVKLGTVLMDGSLGLAFRKGLALP